MFGKTGLGAIFGILSFVGFESASVLGEETRDARISRTADPASGQVNRDDGGSSLVRCPVEAPIG